MRELLERLFGRQRTEAHLEDVSPDCGRIEIAERLEEGRATKTDADQ